MKNELDDEELREAALLALRNSFWWRFSELCNDYIAAAEGLGDLDDHTRMLGELTSIYGRGNGRGLNAEVTVKLRKDGHAHECDSLAKALFDSGATEVYVDGTKRFERVNGEWMVAER